MGHFSTEMPPEHFNRVEPRAITRQVDQDQTTCCSPNDCFDFIILVSDGTAATGMPDGAYRLGTFDVAVSGGVCRNAEGKLAGSTLTLDRALKNIVALDVKLADALAMLTANPARLLRLERRKGALIPGTDADLVLLDTDMQVKGVMTRGAGLEQD